MHTSASHRLAKILTENSWKWTSNNNHVVQLTPPSIYSVMYNARKFPQIVIFEDLGDWCCSMLFTLMYSECFTSLSYTDKNIHMLYCMDHVCAQPITTCPQTISLNMYQVSWGWHKNKWTMRVKLFWVNVLFKTGEMKKETIQMDTQMQNQSLQIHTINRKGASFLPPPPFFFSLTPLEEGNW